MVDHKIRGVVGFVFTPCMTHVLMIRKRRPASQAGLLNGVGGKVEPGETALQAIVREFREETRLHMSPDDWSLFAVMESPAWEVNFFSSMLPEAVLQRAANDVSPTDEQLELWSVHDLLQQTTTLRNVKWLVPFCLDTSRYVLPLRFQET